MNTSGVVIAVIAGFNIYLIAKALEGGVSFIVREASLSNIC